MDQTELERTWDPHRRVFTGSRGPVRLSPREARILSALLEAHGGPVPRDQLDGGGRSVDFAVRRLREKIEHDPGEPRIVLTVHGVGYRLGVSAPASSPAPAPTPRALLRLGDREVDLDLGIVHRLGEEIPLTTLQREVLLALVEANGRIVGRDELFRRAWGRRWGARAVDGVIRQLRTILEPDPAAPLHLVTVRGSGYRFRIEPPRTNLPAAAPLAVGRQAELEAAVTAALEAGCVSIAGPPGVGKSHLAERVCRALAATLPGGAWWVEGSPLRTRAELGRAVCAAMGTTEGAHADAALRTALGVLARRPRTALVLDNLEQIEGVETVILALVRSGAPVVATSSRLLEIPGPTLCLEGLPGPEARELYRAVAGSDAPLPDDPALDALVTRLEGLPLALVLAGRRAAAWPPDLLAERSDRLELLRSRIDGGRHGSIRAALDWCWGLCSPEERRALLACRVFRSPIELPLAARITGFPIGVLEGLIDRSLLIRAPAGPVATFRLHGLVAEWLATRGEPDRETARRWAAWLSARARTLHEVSEIEARGEVDRRLPDLEAAAVAQLDSDPEGAAQIALLLAGCPWIDQQIVEALFERLLAGEPIPSLPRLWAARARTRAYQKGDHQQAQHALDRALAAGLPPDAWDARRVRVVIEAIRGNRAADPGAESPLGRHGGPEPTWSMLRGIWLLEADRIDEGVALLADGTARSRRLGERVMALMLEQWLALGLGFAGADRNQVAASLESAMLGLEHLGLWQHAAHAAWRAAEVRADQGRRAQARALARRAVESGIAFDNRLCEIRGRLAAVRADIDGDPGALLYEIGEIEGLTRAARDEYGSAMVSLLAGITRARLGERERALALVDRTTEGPNRLRAGLRAVGALLDPARPLPEPPVGAHWGRSAVLVASHLLHGTPLTDPNALADRATNPLLRAIEAVHVPDASSGVGAVDGPQG